MRQKIKGIPLWAALLFCVVALGSTTQELRAQASDFLLPKPDSLHESSQWKERTGAWSLSSDGHALRGEDGLLFTRNPVPGDFSVAVRLRYDELRFFARPPFSGIAFHVTDARNYDAIVLTGDECQVAWKQVRNNKESIVEKSSSGLYTEVGQPFWMRLSITKGIVEAALSLDGSNWSVVLKRAEPESTAGSRVGLIAAAPATWFTWGADAASPLPAFVPYVYRTDRVKPADLQTAPVRADYLKALNALKAVPLVAGDSLAEQGLASLRAWQVTHDEFWQRRAIAAAKKMIEGYRTKGTLPIGFASFYQEMTLLQAAVKNNWLAAEERSLVHEIAAKSLLHGQYERGPMNRALGNLVGIKPALELAPDFPQRAQVEKIVRLVEQDFADYGYAPIEDASDYIKVSLIFASIHALESRPDWWQQKGFHDVFADFAAAISPLGRFPGFGDDNDADPPELVGLLELAANKWGDPVFHEAARRLWAVSYGREIPREVKSSEITSLALAATYASEKVDAAPTMEAPETILYRANGTPSKAILRNGSAWMMVDLFAGGEHGHNDSLAITTMESNGTVQLEDNGRYARGMAFHNRPQFVEHAEDFPLPHDLTEQTRRIRQQYFTNDEWTFYHLPLHDHWIWGNFAGEIGLPTLERDIYNPEIPASLSYNPATETALIFDMRGYGRGRISLSDAKITGPDGTQALALTIPKGAPEAERKPNARAGKDVYVWETPLGAENLFLGGVARGSTNASAAKDAWLDFWLKLEPLDDKSRVEINSIALGDRDGYPKRWIDAGSPNGTVTLDKAETVNGAAHLVATEKMISQNAEPILLTRDIFMALPGFVWVRDTTENSGTIRGTAGSIWYGEEPVPAGKNTYRFATGLRLTIASAATTGINAKRTYGMREQEIAYGSQPLAPGATATMDSLLITDKAAWHSVPVPAQAAVWTDGTHWVGRNPAGASLQFDGFKTSEKLFVLTR
jgi:hypothetical protein